MTPKLTPRQTEILDGIVRGETNAEIGRRLFLSEDAIKSHVKHILRVLGARNRTHAAVIVNSQQENPVPTKTPRKMLRVKDVAEMTGLSTMTIYRLIHREELRAYRMGNNIRVDSRDVVEFVRASNTISFELYGSESRESS